MYVDFNSLLGYVFGDISETEKEKIDSLIQEEKAYLDIIDELVNLKKELVSKENIIAFFEEKADTIKRKFFEDDAE